MDASTSELNSIRSAMEPRFFYCCMFKTRRLRRANLITGEQSSHQVPGYQFNDDCRWCELPGGSLIITGGSSYSATLREAVLIDTLRECAVSYLPPMHTPRKNHLAVYHSQYLYVLGGYSVRNLRECERYVCAESRWEVLPALPVACWGMSAVELDNSLYGLGGFAGGLLDTVQKLSLDSLTWELMQLKLPQAARNSPCFTTNSQGYLLLKETLYAFTPLQFKPVKTLPKGIDRSITSYYSRGTLYCSTMFKEIESLILGELTSL
jgi:hypothetical protein